MKVKCFECGVMVEGTDGSAVVDAFIAHGREAHSWSFPELALRNYAHNYVDAVERLTGPVERLAEIGDVTVHAMSEARIDDWLGFFDHDAFADNPDWASCYCLEPHSPPPPEEPERPWREIRETMVKRLRAGTTAGYLAYIEGRCIGWVNASLRADYGLFKDVDVTGPEPRSVSGISCFVIAPPYRRHGVATALLEYAIEDAAGRGASWIEAYPHNKPQKSDGDHFRGTLSMFEARGFSPVETHENYSVVRRAVA